MIVGGIATTRGACPVCGTDVARMHKWTGGRVGDLYRCPDCGDTEYEAEGGTATVTAQPATSAGVHPVVAAVLAA